MTTRYVGVGGNDGNDGLSWANRKLTLNGVENTPVEAGDTVYVGPGIYRELLTVDVSGASGSPITYIGDYTGANTDGTGGVVRITGSDNDQGSARDYCIKGDTTAGYNYRTFSGFLLDGSAKQLVYAYQDLQNWIFEDCYFGSVNGNFAALYFRAGSVSNICNNHLVRRCIFNIGANGNSAVGIVFNHTGEINSSGNVVENCIFLSGYQGVQCSYIGDVIVRNCFISGQYNAGIRTASINSSNKMVVNNCIIANNGTGLSSAAANQVTENYNNIVHNGTARTNVDIGANSNAYMAINDSRWFFEMVNGGTLLTPFDLANYSELIDVAGTSPTTADMRGTTVQGTQREWGALEYDSSLDIEAGSGGGGATIRNVVIPMFIRRR